jgi:hypothetical protein
MHEENTPTRKINSFKLLKQILLFKKYRDHFSIKEQYNILNKFKKELTVYSINKVTYI